MRPPLIALAALTAGFSFVSPTPGQCNAGVAPLLNIDFDAPPYTGAVMLTKPAQGTAPVTDPSSRLSHVPDESSAVVVEAFSPTESTIQSPFGSGHSLVVSKDAPGERGLHLSFYLPLGDKVTGGRLVIQFDFMIDDRTSPSPTGNFFITTRNSGAKAVSAMMLQQNGRLTLRAFEPGTNTETVASEQTALVATLAPGRAYQIKQVFDFTTGTVHIFIDGIATSAALPFAVSESGVMGFDISAPANAVGRWAIDSINADIEKN